jgi:hypothetical protein
MCDVQDFLEAKNKGCGVPLTRVLGLAYFMRSKRLAVS